MMEIEKPFKCHTCNSRFTNEDHLSVHKRRHEMSLSLKSGGNSSAQQQSLDSFVDETPTPTRFFRSCEEVGLFQDLQNVNPFDESFKAASTPSGNPSSHHHHHQSFDFSVALPSSASVIPEPSSSSTGTSSSTSKRRYSDHDTLNTPQVFGYLLSTNTSTSTTVLNPVPSSTMVIAEEDKILSLKSDVNTQNAHSDQKSVSLFEPKTQKAKKNTALRLNLSPITPLILIDDDSNSNASLGSKHKLSQGQGQGPEKKVEILERNRAAASRARQRRKQWMSTLESRCETLEKLVEQMKTELIKERANNQIFRTELLKHSNCDVTKSQNEAKEMQQVQIRDDGGIQIALVQAEELVPEQPPQLNILRQISQPSSITTTADIPNNPTNNTPVLPAKPKIAAKRGRPRKGQERRVQGFCFSSNSAFSTSTSTILPIKVPLPSVTNAVIRRTNDHVA